MIELTTITNTRILIDIKDIRAVLECNNETSIFIYSDKEEKIPVKEDYDTVIKRLKRNEGIESYFHSPR
jgi:uncharacterized protein YlzI (FlbEa/FlbD family)